MTNVIRYFGLLGKTLLALTFTFSGTYILPATGAILVPARVLAAEAVNVWWPTTDASISGSQPFKAVLTDKTLGEYVMFWQVDGGAKSPMIDSHIDYPHKEAIVDLSSWIWNQNATYSVTFIAETATGIEIARNTVAIKNSAQASAPIPLTSATPVITAPTVPPVITAPAPVIFPAPVASSASATSSTSTLSNPTAPAVLPKTAETARLAKVTYPLVGARVSGVEPLKAIVIGLPLGAYKMYWSVDGGAQTELYDSSVGGLHKESMIDFSSWTWKGTAPYIISVVAKNSQGAQIAKASTLVYANTTVVKAIAPTVPATTTAPALPTPTAQPTITNTSMSKLYVDPNNPAISQASIWRTTRPIDAAIMDKLGAQSSGIWLGGWNADVQSDVSRAILAATAQNASATFVAYNIPGRDCGQHSAGGLSGRDAYLAWISKVSAGIGSGKAIVILEPDGITLTDCLSESGKAERYSMISSAIDILAANPGTKVYIDAGHPQWHSSSETASRLSKAGVSKAAGFALNTSNFVRTSENVAYGESISHLTGGKHFVIDTSRNGNGPGDTWCNPSGRALGALPTLSTGNPLIDAYLWIKKPGESDGNCNGGPSAGSWWPEYGLALAKSAGY